MKQLLEVLSGRENNYILPFLWLKGESINKIESELCQIKQSGVSAVCLESRPHPDFLGDGWWSDLEFIIALAKELDMKLWILDDSHFPTGYANGAIIKKHPEHAKICLTEEHMDVIGPMSNVEIMIQEWLLKPFANGIEEGSNIVFACAVKRDDNRYLDIAIDLKEYIQDGKLYWDIPEGSWRIFFGFTTRKCGKEGYINLIDKESVKVLIDEVYEPHYEHYKKDFGTVIAGFFSDEPGLDNSMDTMNHAYIGKKGILLPWGSELESELQNLWGESYYKKLISLWYEVGNGYQDSRLEYMNLVTKLIEKNFSMQIGTWCRDRGVAYIGHIIEDDNAHTKMGVSIGHYYRGLKGQDMAGIDIVFGQLMPGCDMEDHRMAFVDCDGEFYHYGLAQMCNSLAQIDPLKSGNSICEIFGGYGWNTGLSEMIWLVNFMLVHGINHFVPHAYSMAEYPDHDCPPHFYAGGHNPEYPYYSELYKYMNRMCHLLSHGKHDPGIAVLYQAEAEWMGKAMTSQKIGKILEQHQIGYHIIPMDVLIDFSAYDSDIQNKNLVINGRSYHSIIIPEFEKIPDAISAAIEICREKGIQIIRYDELSETIHKMGNKISIKNGENGKELRFYHYLVEQMDVCIVFHVGQMEHIEFLLDLSDKKDCYRYDAMKNRLYECNRSGGIVAYKIAPGECVCFISSFDEIANVMQDNEADMHYREELTTFCLSFKKSMEKDFNEIINGDQDQIEEIKNHAGTLRYTYKIDYKGQGISGLMIEQMNGVAEVQINGKTAGICLKAPYIFEIEEFLTVGQNIIDILLPSKLIRENRDIFSRCSVIKPFGIQGKVYLY